MSPIISIIIPVYNRAELVREALESVLWQICGHWECIIVDDGSTDTTWEVLEEFAEKDGRIRIFKRNRGPKGANVCRNIGIQHAKGDFVMFSDSDDILAPWCIESRIEHSAGKRFDLMVFQVMNFDNSNTDVRTGGALFDVKDPFGHVMKHERPWGTMSVLWNREFITKIGGWYEPAQYWQDPILNMIALSYHPVQLWGSRIPDIFVRVTPGFDRIGHADLEKFANRCDSLLYLKGQISDNRFPEFEKKYLIDIINRIEYLPDDQIRDAINRDFDFILKIRRFRFLKKYFTWYLRTRNKPLLHSAVYRTRWILVANRKKSVRPIPEISGPDFDILVERCREYPFLKDIIHSIKY